LARSGGQPGGALPEVVPPHLEELWSERDRSAAQHRAAYTGLAREAALPWEELYDRLYDRHMEPAAWMPYPDAAEVLGELRRRGIAVAVVSNIGWDLRPVFREHGLDRFVDVFVLSYEYGIQKPDPRIFRIACEGLGLPPEQVAMVGDDRRGRVGLPGASRRPPSGGAAPGRAAAGPRAPGRLSRVFRPARSARTWLSACGKAPGGPPRRRVPAV
jgi:putative hydrolase of the HAD superfamily